MYSLSTVSFCIKEYCMKPIMTTNLIIVFGQKGIVVLVGMLSLVL